jgi:hypothetical protein
LFVQEKNKQFHFNHPVDRSPLIWNYAGEYIDGLQSFSDLCQKKYRFYVSFPQQLVISITKENKEECETIRRMKENDFVKSEMEVKSLREREETQRKLFLVALLHTEIIELWKPSVRFFRSLISKIRLAAWKDLFQGTFDSVVSHDAI